MSNNIRKVWFITRPERDPAFHQEALIALNDVTENFTLKWLGNRDLQKKYEQALISLNVKRNSISKDGSGGRTWAALLQTFCYCYLNNDGFLVPTKCGLEIIKNNNVFDNIKKQILTLQIPNAYFLGKGFRPKFSSDYEIFPVRFLIHLCTRQDLSFFVTKEEITFIVMTAKHNDDINLITNKILSFRHMSDTERNDFKTSISAEYDHRERCDKNARSFSQAFSDIAHTFMLIAEYTQLVNYERGVNSKLFIPNNKLSNAIEQLEYYDSRYPFNKRYIFSLERMAEVNGLDINSYKASRYGHIKPASNFQKKIVKAQKLLSNYPNVNYMANKEIIDILSNSSFSISDAKKMSDYIISNYDMEILNDNFIYNLLHEENNLEFENKTAQILSKFGFDVETHPKINNERTEIDILLKYKDNLCGIIDAKNYKTKFSLSSALSSHMTSEYIPNYQNYKGYKLCFFGYVTCNNIGGIGNLRKISNKSSNGKIKGLMINVQTLLALLDYCIENNFDSSKRINIFLSLINNQAYTSLSQVLTKLKN